MITNVNAFGWWENLVGQLHTWGPQLKHALPAKRDELSQHFLLFLSNRKESPQHWTCCWLNPTTNSFISVIENWVSEIVSKFLKFGRFELDRVNYNIGMLNKYSPTEC